MTQMNELYDCVKALSLALRLSSLLRLMTGVPVTSSPAELLNDINLSVNETRNYDDIYCTF